MKNNLPDGVKGQLKIDSVAVMKEMLANALVRMKLPVSYDFSHLHAVTKEDAKGVFLQAGGSGYIEFPDYNLMAASIDFYVSSSYS